MKYDPIKKGLGDVFNRTPFLRKLFYRMLDLLLLRAWHVRRELRRFYRQADRGGQILDAGSGFGQYTWFMSGLFRGWEITAVDVKEEQVADCNEFIRKTGRAGRVHFKVGDLVTYRDAERYDLILCVDVLEHIVEDVEVLKNYAFSLRKGGMVLISTPSDRGGSNVHHEDEQSFIEEHVRDGYSIDEIEKKLQVAGFRRIFSRYSYGWPGKISWKLSMKYPIEMLNFSRAFYVILPFYYLMVFPFCLGLNFADVRIHHKTGTGLIVKAVK